MTKNRALFAAQMQIMIQVIGSFHLESIRFAAQISVLMADLTWQQYTAGHRPLLTRCRPLAGVAFRSKFWSMQNDCRRRPFGLFFDLGACRFRAGWRKPKETRDKVKNTRSRKEAREETP
jgi:hypothetical protein